MEFIIAALQYAGVLDEHEAGNTLRLIHLSNKAINTVLGRSQAVWATLHKDGYQEIAYSFEYNNAHALDEAHYFANMLSSFTPDKFVLVETGDYIMAPLGHSRKAFETYDPNYHLYLFDENVFSRHEEALRTADRKWRTEKIALAGGPGVAKDAYGGRS